MVHSLKVFLFVALLLLSMNGCVSTQDLKIGGQLENKGQMRDAYRQYEAILEKNPSNTQAQEGLVRVGGEMRNNAVAEAERMAGPENKMTVSTLEDAIEVLSQAQLFDRGGIVLPKKIQGYRDLMVTFHSDNGIYAKEIEEAIRLQNYLIIPQKLKLIRKRDPRSLKASELELRYQNNYGAYLEKEIVRLIKNGQIDKADEMRKELGALDLPAGRKNAFEQSLADVVISRLSLIIQGQMANRQFYTAYLMVKNSGYSSRMQGVVDELKNMGGGYYLDQARLRLESGYISRAYLESVKGYEMNPDLDGMFEMYRDTRDHVFQRMQKYLAIPAFGAPNDSPDLGTQFSDALISYLFRILPYGLNIVERERIDLLLEEQKRELRTVANLLNVDLIINGNVSLLKVDRQNTENMVTVKAKVSEQAIINPEYEIWQKLSSTERAGSDAPPKLMMIPTYQNFTYKKGCTTVKGYTNVSLRVFDTTRGAITYAQEFNAKFQESDKYQDEIQMAGVMSDPKELPSDTEVKEKLRNKVIAQIADVINTHFENRQEKFLKDAEYYISRREIPQAVDLLSQGFLYCVKAKVDSADPVYAEIREKIIELTEQSFL